MHRQKSHVRQVSGPKSRRTTGPSNTQMPNRQAGATLCKTGRKEKGTTSRRTGKGGRKGGGGGGWRSSANENTRTDDGKRRGHPQGSGEGVPGAGKNTINSSVAREALRGGQALHLRTKESDQGGAGIPLLKGCIRGDRRCEKKARVGRGGGALNARRLQRNSKGGAATCRARSRERGRAEAWVKERNGVKCALSRENSV